jgi:two-component system, chemotaxis family, chemotaxis protein CheY
MTGTIRDPYRVMVVDDSEFVVRLMSKMLQDTRFTVVCHAKNGKEAIGKFRELRPDITTMDIIMPQMGGIETITELLQIDTAARILVVSAMGHDAIVEQAMKIGATHYIIKPFRRDTFIQALDYVKVGASTSAI